MYVLRKLGKPPFQNNLNLLQIGGTVFSSLQVCPNESIEINSFEYMNLVSAIVCLYFLCIVFFFL